MTGKEAVACAERRTPVTCGGITYKRISAVIWRYDNEKRIEVEMEDHNGHSFTVAPVEKVNEDI